MLVVHAIEASWLMLSGGGQRQDHKATSDAVYGIDDEYLHVQ